MSSEPASSATTVWTMIAGAARGDAASREAFARQYAPVLRAYLAARWRGRTDVGELDDVVQEVFVECLRANGALERAEPERPGGFRAYLYGVARNVALRAESRRGGRRESPPPTDFPLDQRPADVDPHSVVFDRAWAESIMRQAGAIMSERAAGAGAEAERRVELLRLRFSEDLPIREIAARWGADPVQVHRWYARAREEFHAALIEAVGRQHGGTPADNQREAEGLLELLQ